MVRSTKSFIARLGRLEQETKGQRSVPRPPTYMSNKQRGKQGARPPTIPTAALPACRKRRVRQDATRQMTKFTQCHSTVCRHAYLRRGQAGSGREPMGCRADGYDQAIKSQGLSSAISDLAVCATHHLTARTILTARTKQNDSTAQTDTVSQPGMHVGPGLRHEGDEGVHDPTVWMGPS